MLGWRQETLSISSYRGCADEKYAPIITPTLSQLRSANCNGAIFSHTFLIACIGVTCQTGILINFYLIFDVKKWSVAIQRCFIVIILYQCPMGESTSAHHTNESTLLYRLFHSVEPITSLYLAYIIIMSVVPPHPPKIATAGPSSHARSNAANRSKDFDVVAAYKKALANHSVCPFNASWSSGN